MKKFLSLSLVAAMALSTHAMAEEAAAAATEAPSNAFSMSGNAAMTTNYLWRGWTYTNETPTGQAGLDFSNLFNIEGLYAGTWGSGITAGSEVDLYGGYSLALSDALSIDVGTIYYFYTTDFISDPHKTTSYGEVYVTATFGDYSLSVYEEYDFDGTTAIAAATFGPVDVQAGYYLVPSTSTSNALFGSAGINWPCMLDNSYNMNATVAYNNNAAANTVFAQKMGGAAFALTISKDF